MPTLIRTTDDVMAHEKRDMLFINFKRRLRGGSEPSQWRQKHFDWFDKSGLRYEAVAPSGWFEGDPGTFAVYFNGLNDPRIKEYSTAFEDVDGKSLHPDAYRMVIVQYETWLKEAQERGRRSAVD